MGESFVRLPAEIITIIFDHLPNSDIKALRLTCRKACNIARLRLDRVFLSANPLNISVFRAISDSETFRHGVKEIIWDDARFIKSPHRPHEPREDLWIDPEEGCPVWFVTACRRNIELLVARRRQDFDRPDILARAEQVAAQPPLRICWQYYQNLFYQQEDVIIFHKDGDALAYALPRFPALERVTITPAAHGWLFAPLYKTPMIRAFPKGFNYPIPRGWPNNPDIPLKPEAHPWENESVKSKFRGFGIVTRALAQYKEHHVSQLVIDVNYLETGLNCRVFEDPNPEYNNLASLLRRPNFTRLDSPFSSAAKDIPAGHVSEAASCTAHSAKPKTCNGSPSAPTSNPIQRATTQPNAGTGGSSAHFVPLRKIYPIDAWSNLRHFGLSGFLIDKDDLVSFLVALLDSFRSLRLCFLHFVDHGGSWSALLADMREKLDWRARDPALRPRVEVGTLTYYWQPRHAIWIDQEVAEFLYGDGPNPFEGIATHVMTGIGILKDSFDPGYERPHVMYSELIRRGYVRDSTRDDRRVTGYLMSYSLLYFQLTVCTW